MLAWLRGCTPLLLFVAVSVHGYPNPSSFQEHTPSQVNHQEKSFNMTVRAQKFTPEVMLSAPRRSAAVPNDQGDRILYTVSTYSFSEHKKTGEVRMLLPKSGESILVTDKTGASEPTWIDDNVLLLIPGKDDGTTDVVIGDPTDFEKRSYTAGNINGAASGLKITKMGDYSYKLAIYSQSNPDGSIYNSAKAAKKKTSGKIYNSNFVRHWDTYVTAQRNSIWYGDLTKGKPNSSSSKYTLGELTNALKGTKLESPIPPFGGSGDYDLSITGLAFVAKDPTLDPSTHTKQNLYFLSWTDGDQGVKQLKGSGFQGASSSPAFSPDGKSIAFFAMKEDGYEADKNQLIVVPDIAEMESQVSLYSTENNIGSWDRSPSTIVWSNDGSQLYLLAENVGRTGIFVSTVQASLGKESSPVLLRSSEGISELTVLKDGTLFVSASSLTDNSVWYTLNPSEVNAEINIVSTNSGNGNKFGLSNSQIGEIWWEGQIQDIHAWVLKPSNFDESKTYPLAYLIHGGPQGSWGNSWSTRWNPAIFAEQGYVVICPNPTGSTGYGQTLTDSIQNEWGGIPYDDLVRGFEYIENNLKYVDTDRAVALGASYGGYMVNWIQGHELGRKFKALVTHDGVFSMTGQLASEEQYFPIHEFGGKYMSNPASWLHWDPARFTHEWATPHLVIHSDLDYRLTVSEGLSAFNVLQQNGVASRYLTFPDENHWVLKPENSLLWHAVVLSWINSYVGLADVSKEAWAKELLEEASTEH